MNGITLALAAVLFALTVAYFVFEYASSLTGGIF